MSPRDRNPDDNLITLTPSSSNRGGIAGASRPPRYEIKRATKSSYKVASQSRGPRWTEKKPLQQTSFPLAPIAKLMRSFTYAAQGIAFTFRSEQNFRIHCAISVGVLTLSAWLGLSALEWALVIACIGLVLCAELMNTALEVAMDLLVGTRYDNRVKAVKDVSAGAVFVLSMAAALIGLFIFLPKLL